MRGGDDQHQVGVGGQHLGLGGGAGAVGVGVRAGEGAPARQHLLDQGHAARRGAGGHPVAHGREAVGSGAVAQAAGGDGVEFAALGIEQVASTVLGRDAGGDQVRFAALGEGGGERGGPPKLGKVIGQFWRLQSGEIRRGGVRRREPIFEASQPCACAREGGRREEQSCLGLLCGWSVGRGSLAESGVQGHRASQGANEKGAPASDAGAPTA